MSDCLIEIERKEWPKLRDLYEPNGMKNYISYTTIDNYIHWFDQDPNVSHVKFYCLNGDYSDGTFVITDRCAAHADTFNESYENLTRLLQLIDYSKGYTFYSIQPALRSTIFDAITKTKTQIVQEETVLLYYLSKENALKFTVDPPIGIQLHPLEKRSDVEKVNSVWMIRDRNSLPYLERIAKYNPSIGAYEDDGTLVAWILKLHTGMIGVLQTDEKHFGHGYASLVTKALSKKIAETGNGVYATIYERNYRSRNLFGKLGFKPIGELQWITTKINWTEADE